MAKSPSRFNLSGGDSLNSLGSHGGEVADPMIEALISLSTGRTMHTPAFPSSVIGLRAPHKYREFKRLEGLTE